MKLRDIEVYITCDGVRLDEHSVAADDSSNTISCFVPSTVGKVKILLCSSSMANLIGLCIEV